MKHLLWIDLEMTGLDEKIHAILEVAVVITDFNLNPVADYHRVVFQPPEALALMDAWCVKTHGESGLVAKVPSGAQLEQVDQELVDLANRYFPNNQRVVIAGNSVGNDRRFIDKYLPKFTQRLHYRLVDVSSFKEIFRERYGITYKKKNSHRAVDDVLESINELKEYLSFVNVPPAGEPRP